MTTARFCRIMHQAMVMSLVPLVLLMVGIQSRPLDELSSDRQPATVACPPPNCLYESKCFAHEEEISQGSDGTGWCYGLLCNDGHVLEWDDFDCIAVTTVPPPSITMPSPPTTISKSGCFYNGVWYKEGSEIDKGTYGNGWCFGTYCDKTGNIVKWDDWNCGPSTTYEASSTQSNTNTPPTPHNHLSATPLGCNYNGAWYPPGSKISEGSEGKGWCYGTYCDNEGHVVAWDNWNCGPSTTTETSSSPPTTTPHTPTPLGCLQNGIWYPPGSEISRGSDGEGWCYGEYCTHDGQLQLWDDFNCVSKSTSAPTHSPCTLR